MRHLRSWSKDMNEQLIQQENKVNYIINFNEKTVTILWFSLTEKILKSLIDLKVF
jgi:hypothetical protein